MVEIIIYQYTTQFTQFIMFKKELTRVLTHKLVNEQIIISFQNFTDNRFHFLSKIDDVSSIRPHVEHKYLLELYKFDEVFWVHRIFCIHTRRPSLVRIDYACSSSYKANACSSELHRVYLRNLGN